MNKSMKTDRLFLLILSSVEKIRVNVFSRFLHGLKQGGSSDPSLDGSEYVIGYLLNCETEIKKKFV